MTSGFDENLPIDPHERFIYLSQSHFEVVREAVQRGAKGGVSEKSYNAAIELYALLKASAEYLGLSVPKWQPTGDKSRDFSAIYQVVSPAISSSKEKIRIRTIHDTLNERVASYSSVWENLPTMDNARYKNILQQKINDLRQAVNLSDLPDEHKDRILRRLNDLQKEMDKRSPRIQDVWYGVCTTAAMCAELGGGLAMIIDPMTRLLNAGTGLLAEVNKMSYASYLGGLSLPAPRPEKTGLDSDGESSPKP
ncbi:MAG: hypothetical protein KF684_06340 [Phycisphaeraceae bacterium]|nr:hypothetical protein [Phycisphaeraceae bacterium]